MLILIFSLPIISFIAVLELLLREIPNDCNLKGRYLDKNASLLDVLILGNSHSFYGINPQCMTFKTFNAAYISQSVDIDYAIFKKYSNRLTNLKYIVIPISSFSLFTKLDVGNEYWRMKNYKIYYDLDLSYVISNKYEMFSNSPIVNLKRFFSHYILGRSHLTCSNYGWGNNFSSKNSTNLFESGKTRAYAHNSIEPRCYEENLLTLKKIIELAKTNRTKILFFTPPAFCSYRQNIDSARLNKTINTLNDLANKNSNVVYTNLLSDSSFIPTDFYDADHLNEIGAKKLSLVIDRLLTKWQSE